VLYYSRFLEPRIHTRIISYFKLGIDVKIGLSYEVMISIERGSVLTDCLEDQKPRRASNRRTFNPCPDCEEIPVHQASMSKNQLFLKLPFDNYLVPAYHSFLYKSAVREKHMIPILETLSVSFDMSNLNTTTVLNPGTPLAFLPPEAAYQTSVALYVLAGSLGVSFFESNMGYSTTNDRPLGSNLGCSGQRIGRF
jgi:hypothetical protein